MARAVVLKGVVARIVALQNVGASAVVARAVVLKSVVARIVVLQNVVALAVGCGSGCSNVLKVLRLLPSKVIYLTIYVVRLAVNYLIPTSLVSSIWQ